MEHLPRPTSNQDFFDKAYNWLKDENNYARRGSCMYRDKDGHSCIIGAFIPDSITEHISYSANTTMISLLMTFNAEVRELFKEVDPILLGQVQSLYDSRAIKIMEGMKEIAASWKLTIPGENPSPT